MPIAYALRRLILALLITLPAGQAIAAEPGTGWREILRPDETTQFEEFGRSITAIISKLAGTNDPQRGFHAKGHGAMLAELAVEPGLPPHLRHGVFRESRAYPCWVRFSNGVGINQSDARPDVRGLALKVVGVPGRKLLEGEENALTQDFLMTNNPVSLARDATQFMAFARGNVNPLTLPLTLTKELGLAEALRITTFLSRALSRPIRSLATESFWTGGAIAFGPHAAKLLVRPVGADKASGLLPRRDGLRADLVQRLAAGDVVYDVYVQLWVDEKRTPIEDTSVEWEESVAPPVKVARLTITRRDLESDGCMKEEEYANSLAFTPWHATADLRPIGHTMRARKVVYRVSAQLRRHAPEPTGAERFR